MSRGIGKGKLVALGVVGIALAGLLTPVRPEISPMSPKAKPTPIDLGAYSADKPKKPQRLLFIHHSCGGQLFSDPGPEKERANCILVSHENGGGLRKRLLDDGYEVHEASYGSEIGDKTDLFDWKPKFSQKMEKVLTVDENDTYLKDGKRHDIVMFKSCYPNNRFEGPGTPPGNPLGPELTVANAKAALTSLLDEFKKHPNTLFVYLTAPPDAPPGNERAFKVAMKKILGKPTLSDVSRTQGALARELNSWAVDAGGWLAGYPLKNVVVFDYYDALTGNGRSDLSFYPTGDGTDSHPSSEGNKAAGAAFPAFLNRAVRRAGLSE